MRYRQNNVRKKRIPAYGIVPLLLAVLWNSLAYNGARWIASGRYHYNIETVLDERIPFIPWTLVIYFGCYLFWGINYILIARQEKESVYRFFTADAISRIVCFCFFVLFPTTSTRPEIVADGFWNQAVIWLYSIDAADNLFPGNVAFQNDAVSSLSKRAYMTNERDNHIIAECINGIIRETNEHKTYSHIP